ncbi:MAG: methionyl-tRNA formyltransferase [Acidimicrobiia bacterium]
MALAPPPRHPRRLVYLGTPHAAVAPLRALVDAGFDVALVVTRADKRRGRGKELAPSPVKAAAIEMGLPVSHRVDDVLEANADLGVVVAFGQIIKPHVLERVPMVNVHFSLLPRWRGAAPVERAILAGDDRTGVCIMAVEEGLDTGGVYAKEEVAIGSSTTADGLRRELVDVGTRLLLEVLADVPNPIPQSGEPTYAAKLEASEFRIRWTDSAEEIDRLVRIGGAWTSVDGRRLKVHSTRPVASAGEARQPGARDGAIVATGVHSIELLAVQPEGKAAMTATAWLNGLKPGVSERFE